MSSDFGAVGRFGFTVKALGFRAGNLHRSILRVAIPPAIPS